jgi:hypothetical protein
MATLALSLAGQFVGGLVGGPFGATVGRALGALAGSAVDSALFGGEQARPIHDVRLQGSSEGVGMPRIYGWNRLAGNIVWATELEEISGESRGGKALGGRQEEDEVAASFAVAFCEGEVSHLGRIWADGQLLDTEGLTLRFYRGSETQEPDGLIAALQRNGAPAYRGTCYIVFERLPLARFGNRIPNISAELCRVVGELEPRIEAVTVIPGATEFGYDPKPRLRIVSPGETASENAHVSSALSDWTVSIDELQALCPNLKRVALVVAWFGSDLRCAQCQIGPRVEAIDRHVEGASWSVMGLARWLAPVISTHGGGPAYGGTPSDAAVKAAIADLKARGLEVMLYPIILMDVPHGNAFADPYTGAAGQPAYPWRGRITCHPAPSRPGSPDGTAAVNVQVSAFLANGYRQMHLHYAALAEEAGGVDAMLIGSEMRGMTTLRGAGNGFPFVAGLQALAADVKAVLRPGTKLTYAADWSEYSGYQPAGEKFFHLDPLWASPHIDAVGIDNYMPISDWREGHGHADAAAAGSIYDLDYLSANIAGGEGFDWYYASDADRLAGVRTPIGDGAHGEPWIWRFKDIRSWWANAHHDRPGGVRSPTPTAWAPGSKPIWLTELGCGAVDKGANQPNIFGDPKSAEGGRPYFSTGAPDALMQRQFLRAHARHWADPANNPPGMVDTSRTYLWTWDARPYPAFPALTDVWADGENHHTGHWLTGRLGGLASDELASAIAADHGVTLDAEPQAPLIAGYQTGGPGSAREALEPLLEATGSRVAVRAQGIRVQRVAVAAGTAVANDELAAGDGPDLARRRPDPGEAAGRLVLDFIDRERDYLAGSVTALAATGDGIDGAASALALDIGAARRAAQTMLAARGDRLESVEFALPPSRAALEIGDAVALPEVAEGLFEVTDIRDGTLRRIGARALPSPATIVTSANRPTGGAGGAARALPLLLTAHLPPLPETPDRSRLVLAAYAKPWPGVVGVEDEATGETLAQITRRATIGETVSSLSSGAEGVWDLGSVLEVKLRAGHIADAGDTGALAGTHMVAVETDAGRWEVIAFGTAELVAPATYRLTRLLRGQAGTLPEIGPVSAGRAVIVLDGRATTLAVPPQWLESGTSLRVYGGAADLAGRPQPLALDRDPLLPLPPAHLRARRVANGDVALTWMRRSRADADGWAAEAPLEHFPESYVVTIRNGGTAARTVSVPSPGWTYTAAMQAADFGGPPAAFPFTVAQVSPVLGPGHGAQGAFHG